MQEIVCGCVGAPIYLRSAKHDLVLSASTNKWCGCAAKIRLLRSDDNGWYISEHRLVGAQSLSVKHLWGEDALAFTQAD